MSNQTPSPNTLKALASDIIEQAKRLGATATEVALHSGGGLATTARLGEVETIEYHRDQSIGLNVYVGQQKGSANTSDLTDGAIQTTIQAACDIAKAMQADPYAGLADPERLAHHYPELDLYHPWSVDAEQAIELATHCETLAREQDKRLTNSDGATVSSHDGLSIYANSHGFCGDYRYSRHNVSCTLVAQDEQGMQRDYAYTIARDPNALWSPERVAIEAAQRTLRRLGARQVKTMKTPVVFAAEAAGGLFSHFIAAIRGGNLYRRSSFLVDSAGRQIFPAFMHIHEQPHLLRGLGSAPFDNDGVATQAKDFIKEGVLQGYALGSYAARKLGLETTGNAGGVHNLLVESTAEQQDLSALLTAMDRGVLITELIGQGVNITTGDYSRGAAGFWVEHGEIQYPIDEFTVAGNLKDMYANIIAVGNDIDHRGNIRTGSVLLENMMIAGAGATT